MNEKANRGSGKGMNGKNWERKCAAAIKDAQALKLRAEGKTFQQIADIMGEKRPQDARQRVVRALKDIRQEPAEQVIALETARLDLLFEKGMEVLTGLHLAFNQGSAILDPTKEVQLNNEGKPILEKENFVRDHAPVLAAIDKLVKVMERRSSLLGLDAPKRTEIGGLDGKPLAAPSFTVNFIPGQPADGEPEEQS